MMKIMNALYERKINAMDKNIFIITFFFKNGVEGRDTQYISLCALNKVQYA